MNMKTTTILTVACFALLATGCDKDTIAITQSTNSKVPVGKLFELDGCTVYRFADGGRNHYYTVCGNAVTTSEARLESCGKNCYTTHYYDTSTANR